MPATGSPGLARETSISKESPALTDASLNDKTGGPVYSGKVVAQASEERSDSPTELIA